MKGEISQLFTLASAANGVLVGRVDPDSVYPFNPSFNFCNAVVFVDLEVNAHRDVAMVERYADPAAWLKSFASTVARRAWLTYSPAHDSLAPDHKLAAFAGGDGEWSLVVSFAQSTDSWVPRWEVTDPNAPDRRIWRVTYGRVAKLGFSQSHPEPQLAKTASRLESCLTDAREFASVHDLPLWADLFARAISCLDPREELAFPDYVQLPCLDS